MKRLARILFAVMFLITGETAAEAQPSPRTKLYTRPVPPPRELLDRLNLKMSYHVYVPMDGRQDGLATVQLSGRSLFVQTRSGLVTLIDAESGVTLWRQRVGRPYVAEHALGFNSREVYVVNNLYLYALDRLSGAVNWSFRLEEGVAAPPVADENMIYIASPTGRLTAYLLPRPDLLAGEPQTTEGESSLGSARGDKSLPGLRAARRTTSAAVGPLTRSAREASTTEEPVGPQLIRVWAEHTNLRLELPILLTSDRLVAPTPNGIVLGLGKLLPADKTSTLSYRFPTESPIRMPAGYFDGVAYIGAEDANLYALQTTGGQLLWRYTIGAPISRRPAVTERDVYIVAGRQGMTRLDLSTGQPQWRIPAPGGLTESNAAADYFLAANPKYVYALDRSGRFLILDRRRGVTLSGFDSRDFVFPISNDITDRIYLAANNGLIVCLHDREYPQALRHHQREEEAENPIRKRLDERITDEIGSKEMPLEEMLNSWTKRFVPLRFRIEEEVFRDADRESPARLVVKMRPVKNGRLGDVLQDMLAAIQCTYEIIGDTIVILPAKGKR